MAVRQGPGIGSAVREVVREQVTVDRSAPAAWNHLVRLESWPSWAAHIVRMDPTPPGKLTASTEVFLKMRAALAKADGGTVVINVASHTGA